MKWITLKMHLLPVIFQEIDFVTERYLKMLRKIKRAAAPRDTDVVEEGDSEELEITVKKFNGLREAISRRINELEDFYEDNIEDVRVSNFEKARIRLKKLLMYDVDILTRIESSSSKEGMFVKDRVKKLTEETRKQLLETNLEKQLKEQREKEKEKALAQMTGGQSTLSNYDSKNTKRVSVKSVNESSRNSLGNKFGTYSASTDKLFDGGELARCKELVFKIRLSEEEWKMLVKEKKKRTAGVSNNKK